MRHRPSCPEPPSPSRHERAHTSHFARPYVISWNLTYRCNLACEHCYLDAGGTPLVGTENFADRSELGTEECFRVIDEIAAFAPECVTILTGGEPLLRRDILEIVRRAAERELWVVVGTNGVRITENVAKRLAEAGARGLSLSLDALDPDRHDRSGGSAAPGGTPWRERRFSTGPGSPSSCRRRPARTISASSKRSPTSRTIGSRPRSGTSTSWCRRGAGSSCRTSRPRSTDEVLASLYRIQRKYNGRMLVNAKCAPHYIKTVLENAGTQIDPIPSDAIGENGLVPVLPDQDLLRRGRRLPGGDALHGDTAERGCHALPLPPGFRGEPSSASLADLWTSSGLFNDIRRRTSLGGRCGECEMNGHCGGCRARAYGMTGDLMAEDPLCTHTPASSPGRPFSPSAARPRAVRGRAGTPAIEYGPESPPTIAWDDAAAARMKRIPAFVRGMVVRAVEESCRKNGLDRVTVEELERIRARMPTPKIFGNAPEESAESVMGAARLVFPLSRLRDSTNVRANIRMTPRLPPCEPGVSTRLTTTGVDDEVGNPQREAERDCDAKAVIVIYISQLLPVNGFGASGGPGSGRELES